MSRYRVVIGKPRSGPPLSGTPNRPWNRGHSNDGEVLAVIFLTLFAILVGTALYGAFCA